MSISGGTEMNSAALRTLDISGSTEELQLDADEDRTIKQVLVDVNGQGEGNDHDAEQKVYLGADEFPAGDSVADNTEILVWRRDVYTSDGTGSGGHQNPLLVEFDSGIAWDEHVTLTFEHQERTTSDTQGVCVVFYED